LRLSLETRDVHHARQLRDALFALLGIRRPYAWAGARKGAKP
jgi:hypothetical protein